MTLLDQESFSFGRNAKPIIAHAQKGTVSVLISLSLFAIFAMMALAFDISRAYANKTRLQNLADAMALSAGFALNRDGLPPNTASTRYAETFSEFTDDSANSELEDLDLSDVIVDYSQASVDGPYSSEPCPVAPPCFVRVRILDVISGHSFGGSIDEEGGMVISAIAIAGSNGAGNPNALYY